MIVGGRYEVGTADSFLPGSARAVRAGGELVAVFNIDGALYAIADTCSHAQASLSEGIISGNEVTCPLHGSRFDVRTGAVLSLPASAPVEAFPIEVDGGRVFVTIS